MPIIQHLQRLRQQDFEFKDPGTSMGTIVTPTLKFFFKFKSKISML
jgi:hypothetical protein